VRVLGSSFVGRRWIVEAFGLGCGNESRWWAGQRAASLRAGPVGGPLRRTHQRGPYRVKRHLREHLAGVVAPLVHQLNPIWAVAWGSGRGRSADESGRGVAASPVAAGWQNQWQAAGGRRRGRARTVKFIVLPLSVDRHAPRSDQDLLLEVLLVHLHLNAPPIAEPSASPPSHACLPARSSPSTSASPPRPRTRACGTPRPRLHT
jgi:hypothetical protein